MGSGASTRPPEQEDTGPELGFSQDGIAFREKYKLVNQIGKGSYGLIFRGDILSQTEGEQLAVAVKVLTKKTSAPDDGLKKKAQLAKLQKQLREVEAKTKGDTGLTEERQHVEILKQTINKLKPEVRNVTKQTNVSDIQREVQIMAQFSHPYVMAVHDVFDSPRYYSLVLTLCFGDLRSRKADIQQSDRVFRRFFRQACSALAVVHDAGILHSDIKPDNFAVTCEDMEMATLVLTDFGLAQTVPNGKYFFDNNPSAYAGTLHYLAPEVFRDGRYGKAVDLWGVGACAYYILSNEIIARAFQQLAPPSFKSVKHSNFESAFVELMTEHGHELDFEAIIKEKIGHIAGSSCYGTLDPDCVEFLSLVLDANPETRLRADAASNLGWFSRTEGRKSLVAAEDEFNPAADEARVISRRPRQKTRTLTDLVTAT
mmetsp:Transcript_62770/g.144554  ORF Transcript_62770/g.144554 Transcript_62770/m.144554 type:complete len:428 (-) Transcript_62770:249-1532(-)